MRVAKAELRVVKNFRVVKAKLRVGEVKLRVLKANFRVGKLKLRVVKEFEGGKGEIEDGEGI